jgi:hypothetical protein
MATVTSIEVRCDRQNDSTGRDHLTFKVGGHDVGSMYISKGETKTAYATGHILVGAGDEFVATEQDVFSGEPVIRFHIDGSDISAGYIERFNPDYWVKVSFGP